MDGWVEGWVGGWMGGWVEREKEFSRGCRKPSALAIFVCLFVLLPTAYDFINSGKAIEVSQLTPDTDHAHYTLLTGHFLNNGEVIFIISLQPRTGSDVDRHFPLFHQDSTYRCALSGSNVPNSSGPWGVKLFYTT